MIKATHNLYLLFTLLTLASCGGGMSTEEQIARAQQYIADADYNAATVELKSALQNNGDSAQARWLLGKVYLETGNPPSAEKELFLAQELGWGINDIRPALAQALLKQRKFVQVREMPYEDLEAAAAARLLSIKALAEMAQGDIEVAKALIEIAREKEPESVDIKMVEARLMAGLGDRTGALIVLNEVLEQSPDLAEAWSLQGDILIEQQDPHEALKAYDRSIDLSWVSFGDRVKRALINLDTQDYEAAQADADYLLKTLPEHPAGHYIQGLLHFRNKNFPEAITALSRAEPASRRMPQILFYLGNAHLMEGNIDQASTFANRFFNNAPDNIQARKLLATVQLEQGKFEDVQELIQPLLDQFPEDIDTLNLMANALMHNGETDQAIELLNKVAQLQPDSPTARVRLGSGLMLAGHSEQATDHLEVALGLNSEFQQADFLLVLSLLQRKEFDKAIEAATAYGKRNPADPTSYNLLGRAFLANGQQGEGIAAYETTLIMDPGNPAANHVLANLAIADGDLAVARHHYENTLEHHPNSLEAQLQLAYLDAREQDEGTMVKRLQQAMKLHPTAIAPRILLGRYYLGMGKSEQIAPLFTSLGQAQQRSPQVLHLLALAQLSGKQHLDAQYTLEQLIKSTPQTPSSHHLLAMAAAGSGDRERVKAALQRAVALDANYLPSLIALAKLSQTEGATAEFLQYLEKLTELAPDSPDVLQLQASAAYSSGDKIDAAELSALAFVAAPSTKAMQDLAAYQFAAGNAKDAHSLMLQWVQEHPEDIQARLTLADYLLSNNGIEGAKVQYKAILQIDADNVLALNNLAWNTRLENLSQAMEYSRRAAELAPDHAEVLDTLAVLEYMAGDNHLAHRNIQRALAYAPTNPAMLYHQAMIKAAMGEKASALDILKELLAESEADFQEREESQALLESLRN